MSATATTFDVGDIVRVAITEAGGPAPRIAGYINEAIVSYVSSIGEIGIRIEDPDARDDAVDLLEEVESTLGEFLVETGYRLDNIQVEQVTLVRRSPEKILAAAAARIAEAVCDLVTAELEAMTSGPLPALEVAESDAEQVESRLFTLIAAKLG